LIGRNIDLLSE